MVSELSDTCLITVSEAAARLGLSDATVRRAIAGGRLVYRGRLGGRKLLAAAEVERWGAERQRPQPLPPEPEPEPEPEPQ
jgi:excisionase family DNA binding protein